jgi:hypothetical protein
MRLQLCIMVLAVGLGAGGCTGGATTRAETSAPTTATVSSASASTASSAPSPATNIERSAKDPETVVVLPDIGGVAWTCRGGAGRSTLFRTTFTARNATEKVGFSVRGTPALSETLQPGQRLSTPFTEATHHVWTVEQPVDPYDSTATITIDLRPDPVYACFNPTVSVSRTRISNSTG